jgi:coenzyme PQQ precursor peptide PqqA
MNAFPGTIISSAKVSGELYTDRAFSVVWGIEIMEWIAPKFEEVALNCEINSYVSATL